MTTLSIVMSLMYLIASEQRGLELMEEAVRLQRRGSLTDAEDAARRAVKEIENLPNAGRANLQALIVLSGVLDEDGRLGEAEYYGRTAVGLAELHPEWEGGVYTALANLGQILVSRGKPEEARLILQRALRLASDPGEPAHRAVVPLSFLSALYRSTGEPAKALPLARKALFLLQLDPVADPILLMKGHGEVGEVLFSLGQFSSAARELETAIAAMGRRCVSERECLTIQVRAGAALMQSRRYKEGLELMESGIRMLEAAVGTRSRFLVEPLGDITIGYYRLRHFKDAETAVLRAMRILEDSGQNRGREYVQCLEHLAAIQRAQGRKQAARATANEGRRLVKELTAGKL